MMATRTAQDPERTARALSLHYWSRLSRAGTRP